MCPNQNRSPAAAWSRSGRKSSFPHVAHSKIQTRPGSLTRGIVIAKSMDAWHLLHCGGALICGDWSDIDGLPVLAGACRVSAIGCQKRGPMANYNASASKTFLSKLPPCPNPPAASRHPGAPTRYRAAIASVTLLASQSPTSTPEQPRPRRGKPMC
jgi:hypothetical protein